MSPIIQKCKEIEAPHVVVPSTHEGEEERFLAIDGLAGDPHLWRAGRAPSYRPPAHAPARLRLRLGRPGCGHAAHSRLSWPPEHSAHRHVHGRQPGTV